MLNFLDNSELFQRTFYGQYSRTYRLKGTHFYYCVSLTDQYTIKSKWWRSDRDTTTFKDVLNEVPKEVQSGLLFCLEKFLDV